MRSPLLASGTLLALAACGPADQPVEQAGFDCGGTHVTASFLRETLVLDFDGRRAELRQTISGSGARFIGTSGDDRVDFWERGATATLTVGDQVFELCSRTGPDLTRSRRLSRKR